MIDFRNLLYTLPLRSGYDFFCVWGTRTQPLICVGCSVHYWVSCAINKGSVFEIAFSSSSSTHICLALRRLLKFCLTLTRKLTRWFLCPRSSAFILQRFAEVWYSAFAKHSSFKSLPNLRKAYIDLCLLNRPKRSSFRSLLLNFTLD